MSTSSGKTANSPRRRRWPIVVLIVAVAGVLAWGGHRLATNTAASQAASHFGGRGGRGGPGAGPGASGGRMATPVGAANAVSGDIHVVLNGLGTVTPLRVVTVSAQVAGQLQSVAFREGQRVSKGDLLAQIDPRTYQAALAQAQGNLARDQAQLGNAKLDLARYQTLFKEDSIARQQLDAQVALVHQYDGAIQADQGAVDVAKVNLGYTRVVAPVGGRVGLRQVDPGNNVANGSAIAVITQMQPVDVLFTIPEDNLPVVRQKLRGGETLAVDAWDRTGKTRLASGSLASLDNQIDTSTGTVKVKAEFANDDEALFPNQFVNVKLMLDTIHDATIIPSSALQRGSNGLFVYVIGDDKTVSVRVVKTGTTEGDNVQVTDGLKPGELVVTDGGDRLREGSTVTVPTVKGGGVASSLVDTLPSPSSDTGGWQGRRHGHHRPGGPGATGSGAWASGKHDWGSARHDWASRSHDSGSSASDAASGHHDGTSDSHHWGSGARDHASSASSGDGGDGG